MRFHILFVMIWLQHRRNVLVYCFTFTSSYFFPDHKVCLCKEVYKNGIGWNFLIGNNFLILTTLRNYFNFKVSLEVPVVIILCRKGMYLSIYFLEQKFDWCAYTAKRPTWDYLTLYFIWFTVISLFIFCQSSFIDEGFCKLGIKSKCEIFTTTTTGYEVVNILKNARW